MSGEDPRWKLYQLVTQLGDDEVRVLVHFAEHLNHSIDLHGELHIAVDTRPFREPEARRGMEDALVFLACAWLRDQEKNR